MTLAISIALFLPLVGFVGLVLSSYCISSRMAGLLASTTVCLSWIIFTMLLGAYLQGGMEPFEVNLYRWVPVKQINADFLLHLDALSLLMTLIITGVGFLIHVYSIGYMEHEEGQVRYFACLNLFIFAMLLLVLAGHLLLLFVGWEGVGLASYLLIGFYYNKPAAAQAATKAFVINRIGDLGLLLGLLLTFHLFGTGNISEIVQKAGADFEAGAVILTVLTLLYFVGAVGKSAQLPLYTWLPDAMEGPTPVSALIHAATMVTAGVYLVVRMHEVFVLSPLTLHVIGVVGAVTSLFAALCALSQTDFKRVLAYSTVSQLGLMFIACGAGAFYSAMFHLTSHAFIKALLFLSAGNVLHGVCGETEMEKMGGLSKVFPKTKWLFLIGSFALAGIPPFAGFFSKDLILEQEYLAGFEWQYSIGLVAAILTGVYLIRAYCLVFMGQYRGSQEVWKQAKEAPLIMLVPAAILAVLSTVGGLLGYTFGSMPLLEGFLHQLGLTEAEQELHSGFVITPGTIGVVAGSLFGIGLTAWIYTKMRESIGQPFRLFRKSFYVNELYDNLIVMPLKAVSSSIAFWVEPYAIGGMIKGPVWVAQASATVLQKMQSGQIRSYLAWIAIGSVFIMIYLYH